jgi:hypothetical protein
MTHGNCKRLDNGFDSDLCGCGCAAIEKWVTPDEVAELMRDEDGETNLRALAHARCVIARSDDREIAEPKVTRFAKNFPFPTANARKVAEHEARQSALQEAAFIFGSA